MNNATVMNETQVIQKILEEYLESRKASKVAVEIFTAVKANVQAILKSYLEEDELQECIKQLMGEQRETKATEFETIKIPGSDSSVYAELMKHKPANNAETRFIDNLKEATSKPVKEFEVFVNDPSMYNGKLQFVPGFEPTVGYPYNVFEQLAKGNGLRLGTKDEYILFMGWLITSLINEGRSEENAWFEVCTDSKELGHYHDSAGAKDDFEPTGSRKIAGKCDFANTFKVLARDEKTGGFWIAGGSCFNYGRTYPLADIALDYGYDFNFNSSIGWFVL